ncbi:hypothetical protein BC628DRAFT_1408335 [Trametes gibbosa]|nr:hypothetical protein BC628DRAFT_1408335 [Trametes gibbosa]
MQPLQDPTVWPHSKKRKLMHAPDGFESSKRAVGKAPARKFASAFDDPKRSKSSTTKETLARNVHRLPQPPVAGSSKPHLLPSSALIPITRPSRLPVAQPPVADPSSRPVSVQSRHAAILSAHRIVSPAPPKLPAKPLSKGTLRQFQPVLPIPTSSKDPPRNMRPLQPPPPPPVIGPPKQDPSKLKTILTTRLAVALDPWTENGTDELLSIYFEQNAGTYVPPAERELQRGLKQSPEKASKSKSAKFIRGGLAQRAQRVFAKHNTTLALWYKDMELQAQRPQVHSRVSPDLCVRIVEVLHISSVASLQRSQSVPRLCVARCSRESPGNPREPEEIGVVLDFGSPGSSAAKAHTLDDVKAERELQLWRPWNLTQVAKAPVTDLGNLAMRPFQLPLGYSILFCARFRIMK